MGKWIVEVYEFDKPYQKLLFEFENFRDLTDFIFTANVSSTKSMNFTVYQQENEESEGVTE